MKKLFQFITFFLLFIIANFTYWIVFAKLDYSPLSLKSLVISLIGAFILTAGMTYKETRQSNQNIEPPRKSARYGLIFAVLGAFISVLYVLLKFLGNSSSGTGFMAIPIIAALAAGGGFIVGGLIGAVVDLIVAKQNK